MKTFLKKYWSIILLVIILVAISVLSFVSGKFLLSNDNYSPELNSGLTFLRSLLSPAWRGYRVLGFASDSEQADIFRTGLMGIFGLATGKNIIGQIYYLICLCVGSISMGVLVKNIFDISKLNKYSNLVFLVSGILYISTLWTVWTFYQSMAPYITNFGFLPLLLYCVYRYVKDSTSKNALWLFLASLVFTAVSVIATLFVVDFVFIVSFTIFWSIYFGKTEKIVLKKILKTLGIFLTTQLFWILPFIYYTLSTSQDIIGSYVNRTITSSVIDLETQMQTAINTARFYSRILTDSNGTDYLYPISQNYFNYDFYKVISLIPAFLSLLGMVFAIMKRNFKYIFFFIFVFATWFLIKVTNQPLGVIFSFMQDHVPLFKQVLRWPSSKLYEIFLVSLNVCAVWGLVYFSAFLNSFFKSNKIKIAVLSLLTIIVLVPTAFYMEYVFTGHLFSEKALVTVPTEYFNLEKYLEEKDSSGRIYYAPPSNENYFRTYDWGFRGSQFISYILPNPVMDMSSAVGSSYGENAMDELAQVFKAGDSAALEKLLQKYDVKYILVDRSLVAKGFTYNIDWKLSETLWNGYESIWKENFLELYKVPQNTEEIYTEVLNDEEINTFSKNLSSNPTIVPYSINTSNWSIDGNKLVSKFTYRGSDSLLSSNLKEMDWKKLPTQLKTEGDSIIATPSYPYIVSSNYSQDPFKDFKNSNFDYFVLNGRVYSKEQLQTGITNENEYGTVKDIRGILNKDFLNIDLTNTLSQSEGKNCADTENKKISVKVSNQGVASGLEIKGGGAMPCAYSDLQLDKSSNYVMKVNINWEQGDASSIPGFCLYSENSGKCLNEEKFLLTGNQYGEREVLVPVTVSGSDNVSLILYALRLGTQGDANIIFRKASIEISTTSIPLSITSESEEIINRDILLTKGHEYTVAIPLVYGENSYISTLNDKTNYIWQPSIDAKQYSVTWKEGMENSVKEGYLNFSNNLLSTISQTDYLAFWKGENISNIPSSLCLAYVDSNECWAQKLLLSSTSSSQLFHFTSSPNITNTLSGIVTSVSYANTSVNRIEDVAIMKSPAMWEDIKYIPLSSTSYTQVEASSIGNPVYSTFYKVSSDQVEKTNTILTIPQSQSSGWLAITNKGNILNDKVTLNGWKQGWDISNTDFSTIYILYWPNLLGYLGYMLIVVEFTYLLIKVFRKRKHGK